MIRCLNCHAETSNGLALCDLCQRKAFTDLEFLPVYFRNLARWRPGRAGSRPVPGSRVLYDGEGRGQDRVSRALDEAGNALATWARTLTDDRGIEAPTGDTEADQAVALCRWFAEHLTSIATLEWCGEFLRGIGHWESKLWDLTDKVAPGWYAGACRRCGTPTHVVPGLTWVRCDGCGATTYARDHLDVIRSEARDWVARPMRLAEAAVALIDTEQSVPRLHKRISKWAERGPDGGGIAAFRRLDVDGDPVGPKRMRFGDVLDMLAREGQTRLGEATIDVRSA